MFKVSRFPGAVHKSFDSHKEAADWLARRSPIRYWHITALKSMADSVSLNSRRVIPDLLKSNQKSKEVDYMTYSGPNKPKDDFAENDEFIPLAPPSEVSLSQEQNMVLNLVKDGRSVFFTGSAGRLHSCRRCPD